MYKLGFGFCPLFLNRPQFNSRLRETSSISNLPDRSRFYQVRAEATRGINAGKRAIIVVDVGSSSVKSALYHVESANEDTILGPVFRKALLTTTDNYGIVSQKPSDWYTGALETIRHVLAVSKDCRVIAISVTGQMQDLIGVGDSPPDMLKYDAILYADCRAVIEARELTEKLGVTVLATSLLAKLKLLPLPVQGKGRPQYSLLLGAADFITYMFTGCPDTTYTDATTVSTTGLSVPPYHRTYDMDVLRHAGLDSFVGYLPDILDRPRVIGTLCKNVAQDIGFECLSGISVIHAGGDAFTTTVGAGCSNDGSGAYLYAGTTGWVARTVAQPHFFTSKPSALFCLGHASEPNHNIIAASVASVGSAFIHGCALFLGCRVSEIDGLADDSEIGARGVVYIPYINGRRCPSPMDSTTGGFYGVTVSTTRADLARALVEGVVFSFVEAVSEFPSPIKLEQLHVVGGVNRCQTFVSGISTLIGRTQLCQPEAGLAGAGEVAAFTLAVYPRHVATIPPLSHAPLDSTDVSAWRCSLGRWRKVLKLYESFWV